MHLRNAYICQKIIKWKELKIETGRITNRKYVKKPYQLLTPPQKSGILGQYIFILAHFATNSFDLFNQKILQ